MTTSSFEILGKPVGGSGRAYVVAEVGINHGGDVALARHQILAAAEAGADAVKLQTFRPELFIARSSPYYGIFEQCALSDDEIRELQRYAAAQNIVLFSAVFDDPSVALWQSLDAPVYKIASGDLTHLPLIRAVAHTGRPVLISTGCGDMDEIETAIAAVRGMNPAAPVALFHCVSEYPTPPADANLAAMALLRDRFGVPVGFSDHTEGVAVPVAAVAMGAELIEKHFTHDREADGPDHALSLAPDGFSTMVAMIREAEAAIGVAEKAAVEGETVRDAIRRSVTAFVDIPEGTVIENAMLAIKRPGTGIPPADFEKVVGRRAARSLAADETLRWDDLAD